MSLEWPRLSSMTRVDRKLFYLTGKRVVRREDRSLESDVGCAAKSGSGEAMRFFFSSDLPAAC